LAQQQIGADLRQHARTRIPTPFPCSFMPLNIPPWWKESSDGLGVAYDISLHGIKVMSEILPPPGEQLALTVRLPHQQSPLNLNVATVRWRASDTFGLEFSTLPEFAAERLREFIVHTSTDRTEPVSPATQIGECGTGPERLEPKHSIKKAQEDAVTRNGKKDNRPALPETASERNTVKRRQPTHRSQASSLIRWGLFLIALAGLYQAWPTDWLPATPQPLAQSTDISAVPTASIPDQNTRAEAAGAAIAQTRLVESGQAPNTALNAIRTELKKELDAQAESGLRKRAPKALAKTGPAPESSSQLQTAKVSLPALQNKKQIAPKSSPQSLPRDTSHFTVVFDGSEDRATWIRMRAILDYAYQEIGQKFGYVPDRPIKVVLHMKQKFPGEMGTPAWADTLFDQTSGTIHIPARQALEDLAWFSRVVRHEFVHALLHARMSTQPTVAPTWLVEGLAIQLAEDPWSDLDEVRKTRHPFIPLASLHGRWKEIPADSLPMAYVEADLATRSLTERYGIHGVRQVLNVLRDGKSLDAAMRAKLSLPYDKFQQQWAKEFKVNLRQGLS
jgi:PilZ domain